jgi:hypothetical protein
MGRRDFNNGRHKSIDFENDAAPLKAAEKETFLAPFCVYDESDFQVFFFFLFL